MKHTKPINSPMVRAQMQLENSLREEISPICKKYIKGEITLRTLYKEIKEYVEE